MAIARDIGSFIALAACATAASAASAQTINSVAIWPIDPAIENHERATPLWLENPGKQPILMQVRVFAWDQSTGEDRFAEQREVAGTPPMVRIAPGQRQLVRLTRMVEPPPGHEKAYRVIVDEIPQAASSGPAEGEAPGRAAAAIQFRMRYSLPLFVYGEGVGREPAGKQSARVKPALVWRTVRLDGKPHLEIRNNGNGHARLATVAVRHADGARTPLDGVNGYVLPGATRRWPIPDAAAPVTALDAAVNGGEANALPTWTP